MGRKYPQYTLSILVLKGFMEMNLLGNVNFDDDPAEFGLSRLFPFDESSDDEKSNKTALHNESTRPVSRRVIVVLLDDRNRRSKND